ncbi:hypothetical protein [Bombilactobacillus bombi]|uniref:hypothetical protein n=1 Tax=Bombilactobacillus bombi TaxID=1303590 RepID=UPI0035ECE364
MTKTIKELNQELFRLYGLDGATIWEDKPDQEISEEEYQRRLKVGQSIVTIFDEIENNDE